MGGFDITLDPKTLQNVIKRLQKIERDMNPAPRTPMGDLINITALDIAREAKKRSPVDMGRLRSSIHPKLKPSESFVYNDDHGKSFNGTLSAPVVEGKEVVVGTNVEYALSASFNAKDSARRHYLNMAVVDATPAMKRRLKSLAEKVVGGKPNINIT